MAADARPHGGLLPADAKPHDAHAHGGVLQHHFDSLEQQRDASTLGMWAFVAQEAMFFGGLFTAYIVYRFLYPEAFHLGSHQLNVVLGGINTAVLISSSLTMAMAVWAAQTGRRKQLTAWLTLTLLLGLAFLVVKYFEYAENSRTPVPRRPLRLRRPRERAVQRSSPLLSDDVMHAIH